ncbi:MAG: hypothetical protein V8R82_02290 [Clostridia bacterium]
MKKMSHKSLGAVERERERERERESYSLVKINLNLIPIITLYNYII